MIKLNSSLVWSTYYNMALCSFITVKQGSLQLHRFLSSSSKLVFAETSDNFFYSDRDSYIQLLQANQLENV